MYFGDRKLVEQYLPTIQAILNFFKRHLAPEGYVDKIGGSTDRIAIGRLLIGRQNGRRLGAFLRRP